MKKIYPLIWTADGYKPGTAYNRGKEQAREHAIQWQYMAETENFSYSEIVDAQKTFSRLARRYGLIREFRENGII